MADSVVINPTSYTCIPNVILKSSVSEDGNLLNVCHLNAFSILNKMDEIRNIVNFVNFHVICVVESWLHESINSKMISISNFKSYRSDRPTRGGGIIIYVKFGIRSRVVGRVYNSGCEALFVELRWDNVAVLIGCVYLPPPVSSAAIYALEQELKLLAPKYSHLVLLGDFNINILQTSSMFLNLNNMLSSFSLIIHNTTTFTYFTQYSRSLLDLVIIPKSQINSLQRFNQIAVTAVSNHDMIYCSYILPDNISETENTSFRNYAACNISELSTDAYGKP